MQCVVLGDSAWGASVLKGASEQVRVFGQSVAGRGETVSTHPSELQKRKTWKPSVVLHLCIIIFKKSSSIFFWASSSFSLLFSSNKQLISTCLQLHDIPAVLQCCNLTLHHPFVKHYLLLQLHPSVPGQLHLVVQVQHDPPVTACSRLVLRLNRSWGVALTSVCPRCNDGSQSGPHSCIS